MALRVGLRIRDRLHAALQLNQDHVHARSGLAGGAVVYGAVERACGSAGYDAQQT